MSPAPELEARFLQPEGWQWDTLNAQGFDIRFGHVSPENPEAIIVCLPGLGEFCEKYFEVAHDVLAQNMAFWVIDWPCQGQSERMLEDPQKRHSAGYEIERDVLHDLFQNHIEPSNKEGVVCAMLAHSMGGNIGLHYLSQYPWVFQCAAFSAPLFGVKEFENIPPPLPQIITKIGKFFFSALYAPKQKPWSKELRDLEKNKTYSHDEKREEIHNAWCLLNPNLQVGGATWQWLYETVKSCSLLKTKKILPFIQAHCLIASAGQENMVANRAIEKISKQLFHAKHITFEDAFHEIIMEKDEIRSVFFNEFFDLIKNTKNH